MYLREKAPKKCEEFHPSLGAVFHPQHGNFISTANSVKNIKVIVKDE